MVRHVSPLAALVAMAALTLALACSSVAVAQDGMTKATAEALLADGKKLMAAGDHAAACPKFAASQKLDPGVGAVLDLADCYEKLGRIASAWAEFRSAASAGRAAGSSERERAASDRAKALEGRLSYLTITTASGPSAGVQITRDGSEVEPAVFGTPIPIDPGPHTIEAAAPGKRKWSVGIEVSSNASRVTVHVPDLADGTSPIAASTPPPAPPDPRRYGTAQRNLGIGIGILGAAGVAVGTLLGLNASSTWDDAKAHCSTYPSGCDSVAVSLAQDAKASSNAATVAFVIGGAGLAGGALLFFTAPKNPSGEKTLSLRLTPSVISLAGAF